MDSPGHDVIVVGAGSIDGTKALLTEHPFSALPLSRVTGMQQRPVLPFRSLPPQVQNEVIDLARVDPLLRQNLPVLLYTLGTTPAGANRHQEAIASFQAALAEDPGYGEAARELAASERALGLPRSRGVPR